VIGKDRPILTSSRFPRFDGRLEEEGREEGNKERERKEKKYNKIKIRKKY